MVHNSPSPQEPSLRIAVWSTPLADLLVQGLPGGVPAFPIAIEQHDTETCLKLLSLGVVEAVLLPTSVVFSHPDLLDVLPAVALSSWKSPFAKLVLHKPLDQVATVAFSATYADEAFVARIVLREHYGVTPTLHAVPSDLDHDLLQAGYDATLLAGPEAVRHQPDSQTLDLGQEWYELANYPMVWGLFAIRKDEGTPEMVEGLIEWVEAAEGLREAWAVGQPSPTLQAFVQDDLRLRFDDLALASLTELRQWMYYDQVTEEVPELPLYSLPEDEDETDPDSQW